MVDCWKEGEGVGRFSYVPFESKIYNEFEALSAKAKLPLVSWYKSQWE
jgi:hypothetical protein